MNNFKGPELNKTCVLLVVVAALAGCVQPPKSPMEREARMAAAALNAEQVRKITQQSMVAQMLQYQDGASPFR